VTDPVEIGDHVDRALANFTSKFRGADGEISPLLKALVEVVVGEVQTVEELMFSLIGARYLGSASGAQLDQYGSVVGSPRDGLSDAEYRGFIAAQILINQSEGEIPRIIQIAALITGAVSVYYIPDYPAAFTLQYNVSQYLSDGTRDRVYQSLLAATPSGVGFNLVEARFDAFGFADDPEALGFGLGEWAENIGGTP
jgi:hypothetical protein